MSYEIERKFLIDPKAAYNILLRGERVGRFQQGYVLRGETELRVRHIQGSGTIRSFFTLKSGSGIKREEVEFEIPFQEARALDKMVTHSVVKSRFKWVNPNDFRVWEFDIFEDRELILAEIELGEEDTDFEIPDWLAPFIVREVTDDKSFSNQNLALPLP